MARSNSRWPPWAAGSISQLLPVDVDEPVAGPQVAVEAGRWLGGAADLAQPVGVEPLERGDRALGQRAAVASEAGERRQALGGVELGPRVARLVGQAAAAGGAPVLAPEARRRRLGGARPARGRGRRSVVGRGRPCSIHAEHEERGLVAVAVGHGEHLGHRDRARLARASAARRPRW